MSSLEFKEAYGFMASVIENFEVLTELVLNDLEASIEDGETE